MCAVRGRVEPGGLGSRFLVPLTLSARGARCPQCPYITDPLPLLARPAHLAGAPGRPLTIDCSWFCCHCCCNALTAILILRDEVLRCCTGSLVLDRGGLTHALGRSEATFAVSDPRTSPQEFCRCMLTTKPTHRVVDLGPACVANHTALCRC